MISLILKRQSEKLYFDLICDHTQPVLYNAYEGSFTKDFIEARMNKHVISLFNRFDLEAFKDRIENNGSTVESLVNGVRVGLGEIPQKGEGFRKLPFADAVIKSLERYLVRFYEYQIPPEGHVSGLTQEAEFNVINVVFGVKGCNNYMVCLSLNDALSTYFLKKMVEEDGVHQELHELIVDSISEVCNTVIGNAFTVFEECHGDVRLGVPLIFRFARDEEFSCNIPMQIGEIQWKGYAVKTIVINFDEVENG